MKKLELKHITPYLPYELKVDYNGKMWYTDCVTLYNDIILIDESKVTPASICEVKPILRPLSSMSLEEIDELNSLIDDSVMVVVSSGNWVYIEGLNSDPWSGSPTLSLYSINKINEYLLSKHFDVFRLIDKGLAIEK